MAHYTYDNLVIENKYNSVLETKLDLNDYITIDTTMTEGAGDTKRIIYRSVEGQVDEVEKGEGNTHSIEVTGRYEDYKLKTTQAYGHYYDEDAQKDGLVVDKMLEGMAEKMTNNWNEKIMNEYAKAVFNEVSATKFDFDSFSNALALFEELDGQFFAFMNAKTYSNLQKSLKDNLSQTEDFVRTGYLGKIAGVSIKLTKIAPDGEIIIAAKKAVTAFINKKHEVENERDADKRDNKYWMRTVSLIALTNEKYVCRIAAAATTDTTVTTYTKAQKTVAGAATTGATVKVYVNGELKKETVADSSAYSVTLDENLSTGDIVEVTARKSGEVSSTAKVTVA